MLLICIKSILNILRKQDFSEELIENHLGISYDLHLQNMAQYNVWKLSQQLHLNLNSCK